jgi:predicted N-formylglutamate amidohydrolase
MDEAFEVVNANGQAPVVLICEHASNFVPDHLGLSLSETRFSISGKNGFPVPIKNW